MAGPVWRKTTDDAASCDACLAEGRSFMAEGLIVDGELIVDRRLCPSCYEKNRKLVTRRPIPCNLIDR